MATEAEMRSLRGRMQAILSSNACREIRFKMDNVTINNYMFISTAVADNRVKVELGDGHHYDHRINTITFDSLGVTPPTIVHEATHAVIDANHFNHVVTTGTHEAAAYIAETVYALATNDKSHTLDVSGLREPLHRIAEKIRAFCAKESGVCPLSPGETQQIKLIIGNSALRVPIDHEETMDGIPTDNQTGGLLRRMWLEGRK